MWKATDPTFLRGLVVLLVGLPVFVVVAVLVRPDPAIEQTGRSKTARRRAGPNSEGPRRPLPSRVLGRMEKGSSEGDASLGEQILSLLRRLKRGGLVPLESAALEEKIESELGRLTSVESLFRLLLQAGGREGEELVAHVLRTRFGNLIPERKPDWIAVAQRSLRHDSTAWIPVMDLLCEWTRDLRDPSMGVRREEIVRHGVEFLSRNPDPSCDLFLARLAPLVRNVETRARLRGILTVRLGVVRRNAKPLLVALGAALEGEGDLVLLHRYRESDAVGVRSALPSAYRAAAGAFRRRKNWSAYHAALQFAEEGRSARD